MRSRHQKRVSVRASTEPSKTKQSMLRDSDINVIVERFKKTGQLGVPGTGNRRPIFGEIPSASYHAMLNKICDVDLAFSALSPKLRARFRNSPLQLLRFLENPDNAQEAVKIGLLDPKDPPKTASAVQQDLVQQSKDGPPKPPETGGKAQ